MDFLTFLYCQVRHITDVIYISKPKSIKMYNAKKIKKVFLKRILMCEILLGRNEQNHSSKEN